MFAHYTGWIFRWTLSVVWMLLDVGVHVSVYVVMVSRWSSTHLTWWIIVWFSSDRCKAAAWWWNRWRDATVTVTIHVRWSVNLRIRFRRGDTQIGSIICRGRGRNVWSNTWVTRWTWRWTLLTVSWIVVLSVWVKWTQCTDSLGWLVNGWSISIWRGGCCVVDTSTSVTWRSWWVYNKTSWVGCVINCTITWFTVIWAIVSW